MTDQTDKQEIAHLKRVNAELTTSFERCRSLLLACRRKLAANSNDPLAEQADGRKSDNRSLAD
jgi:hypothetical protein